MSYHRNAFTWTAFGALFSFGYLNAVLGPSLPYIRSVEGISYLVWLGDDPRGEGLMEQPAEAVVPLTR
jgi:hypothetical protein